MITEKRIIKICLKCGRELNIKRSINQISDGVSLEELKEKYGCNCKKQELTKLKERK